jgi:hypothetical protein
MAVGFTGMKPQGVGNLLSLLRRERGLWDLVIVSKEMPTVQALFRPDYTPPLLPISFPVSWSKHGFDLGLFW